MKITFTIKAVRELDTEELELWAKLKNREKTLADLGRGLEAALSKTPFGDYEVKVKAGVTI